MRVLAPQRGAALPAQLPSHAAVTSSTGHIGRSDRHRHVSCAATRRQVGPDGWDPLQSSSDCIDTEWKRMRMQPLWQNLSAELDRCWAARSFTEETDVGISVDESWDQSDAESFASASPSALQNYGARSGMESLWPAARTAYSSTIPTQQNLLQDLSQVFVILFGVGVTETEGIYSLRVMSRDDGLPQDTIIAFTSKEDAERYAGLLEATMDHVPTVCPITPNELLDFCTDSAYSYRVEPAGSLLIPPDYYIGTTDWERSLRLREGKWSVMERDLSSPPSPAPESSSSPSPVPQPCAEPLMSNNASLYPMSDSSYLLEEARARLERLLPKDC